MDNCIFCKIAAGIIPSTTVYETEDLRVIADIAPANLGHLLILPKEHAADFTQLSEEKAEKVMKAAHKIVKAMKKGLKPDGINVLQNNGTAAGQTVMHYHMHIIPRYENDNVNVNWTPMEPGMDAVAQAAQATKAALEEE
ncbi:MAG: HIT family protein [Firmicutes bacterium]|nr:HIT family protein [Bacillota bacterium]